jgi:hypothetical protein
MYLYTTRSLQRLPYGLPLPLWLTRVSECAVICAIASGAPYVDPSCGLHQQVARQRGYVPLGYYQKHSLYIQVWVHTSIEFFNRELHSHAQSEYQHSAHVTISNMLITTTKISLTQAVLRYAGFLQSFVAFPCMLGLTKSAFGYWSHCYDLWYYFTYGCSACPRQSEH